MNVELHKGGISYEINETLYFENGQEIEEMLGISLDPDITLQMYENYVQIRGIILLQGEYLKNRQEQFGQMERDVNTQFIEKIIEKDEFEAAFTHRFPLDISIPDERIEKLENVSVVVDAFDYELPDIRTLKVNASILIQGLKEEEVMQTGHVKLPEEEEETSEVVELQAEQEDKAVAEEVTNEIPEGPEVMAKTEADKTNNIDIQYKETEETDDEEVVKDVRFLTELFGGEKEESYTKIKLYITQEDDTIESIAKHYHIPALQLMKDNNLSGDGITEGQLLHITAKQ